MLTVNNLSVVFSDKKLFENVNLKFISGNCYGVIGANGAGKSTFLKILSKEIEATTGDIILEKNQRMSTLEQDHFKFDEQEIVKTVIQGYTDLYDLISKREILYAKEDFTEEDGFLAADLEEKFSELNGWEAESEAEKLLHGLQLEEKDLTKKMHELNGGDKVKVLLAQSLFGNPDILILDEPTNHLDFYAIKWLEEFLINFEKTVIVVSHDRHFLNNVCTHTVDIDYQDAKLFMGNYDFWRESSELAQELLQNTNQKKEDQIKQLQDFVARFSANASKSKQATSRKKTLEKITLDDIKPTSRKYPYIDLKISKPVGRDVVELKDVTKVVDGQKVIDNISFKISDQQKVVFISKNETAISTMLDLLSGTQEADSGEIIFGKTIEKTYMPKDFESYFKNSDLNLIEWLRPYSMNEQSESYIRGFLGKMLFSGEQPLKKVNVLSGGEKVRMMFSKLMLDDANVLILDQPTNHLDMESIQSVNESLTKYEGGLFFSSHDYTFIESIATMIVTLTPNGAHVYEGTFEEYLNDEKIREQIKKMESKD